MCKDDDGSNDLRRLPEWLAISYGDEELRQLARLAFLDAAIARAIPGAGASVQVLAFKIVELMRQHHGAPPESFWSYLLRTRPHRASEIGRLRAARETLPGPRIIAIAAAPDREPGVKLCRGESGTCDLLDLLADIRAQSAVLPHGQGQIFSMLVPGTVNGLHRELSVSWTKRAIALQATPCLYRGATCLPNHLELSLPLTHECLQYFPRGRSYYRLGLPPPVVSITVDEWGAQGRRLILSDAELPRFVLEFVEQGAGR